ncbi:MAG: phosphoribosylformylglycinamidine cyclo-ligase [Legionellales bacterium]|nr:phosphoribosylformylglycinamidine cyclo-ligase [Legionellales bacterium]
MSKPLTYQDAGVNIDAGNALVQRIKPIAQRTHGPQVLTGLGGFGALFSLSSLTDYQQPILVSSTDGVGTKLKLAIASNRHKTIGIDLVAMCVNDIITCGAQPLFFLDYYATSQLSLTIAESVIQGIGQGCEQAHCALIGGETAEMPDLYQAGDYDLAGFCVGMVDQPRIIDGRHVQAGDQLIGLASTGAHANGYSLIRKIITDRNIDWQTTLIDDQPLIDHLLTPTQIYVTALAQLQQALPIKALAHITGGGLLENIPRVLPTHCQAQLDTSSWPQPSLFHWLAEQGQIESKEMYRTFNCGIGMVVCVAADVLTQALTVLQDQSIRAFHIGEIVAQTDASPTVTIDS